MVHTGQVNNTESLSCTYLPRATATHLCGFLPTKQNKTMSLIAHVPPYYPFNCQTVSSILIEEKQNLHRPT